MKLFLVRHGQAQNPEIDPACGLSERGKVEARLVGQHLKDQGCQLFDIHCSTKARAQQTAKIIATKLGGKTSPTSISGLAPIDPVEKLASELQGRDQDLMIVSHLPFLPSLAAQLLAGAISAGSIIFTTAGVLVLKRDKDGVWSVEDQFGPESLET
ncbi:MAG: phosphohistidine phosphatase SixA [Deltaproteobacteria bacterium]|nr:phosphohistidine phosphatase SixA [Deltaproteobacteria bacterium]